MEVLLLGPLELRDRGRALTVSGNRPRALLALLALNAGRVMQADRLIELIWGDAAPASATNALQVHIAALRKVLEPGGPPYRRLVSERSGYALKLGPDEIDCARFEGLVDRAHRALESGDIAECARLTADAIDSWRGAPLADMAHHAWAIGEARRLEELRMIAEEDRVEAELALGRHEQLVPQLQALLARDPLRERLSGQLMLALYRSGRQADASDVYQRTRAALVEQLGMEPSPPLQDLLKAILNQDPSLGRPRERPSPRRDNLPAPLTSFVGRIRETDEVASRLLRQRFVTLTGPGGIGKSRIAMEVARRLVDRYEDGVWWTSLDPVASPDLLPQIVASTLVVRVPSDRTATEALTAYLNSRKCLLLLDNCEHLIDAAARLTETLISSCPGVAVMCTSREALNVPGEVEWPVPPLDAGAVGSEAVELFRQRAAAALETSHADELDLVRAAELCRRLEGIPLAIELAAAKLKLLSLEELTARIGERFETLTGGSRTAPARHQTLRAAIAWSYELLPEPERALFRRLTTFLGSFTLEAAEAVCVDRLPNAVSPLDGLSSLARKSLIRVERTDLETRYRLLDTIREYGHERLRETEDLQPIGKRHRDYYLDLAERAAPHLRGPTANLWMARLTREQDNIHAALEWSLADGDAETYGRFLIALWWFWYVRCLFDEGRRRIGIALAELQPASPASRVALLLASGQLAWAQGDHDSDRVMFNEALSLARELNDEALLGHVLLRLSLADYAASQMHEAQAHLTESIRLLRKHGRTSLLAEALNNLGWIEGFELNNRFAAAQLLEESLSLARQCGDLWTLQEVLDSMAALKATEGDIDAAEIMQEESLRTNVALGDVWSLPRVLAGFTRLAMVRGQAERALRLAGAASRLRGDVGMVLMAAEDMQLSPLVRAARASLGSPKAEAAWADGLQMTMADAVSYALGDSER